MADDLGQIVDDAVTALREGTDREMVAALIALAGAPPEPTIETLTSRVLDRVEDGDVVLDNADWLPSSALVRQVIGLLLAEDATGLVELAGGSYDQTMTLLVASVAALMPEPAS